MKKFQKRTRTLSSFDLKWSEYASEDRRAIFDYIEVDSPLAAINVDRRISEQIEFLWHFPEMGRPGRVEETRELVILHTPFIAVYRVGDGTVSILRILHGAQQWPEEF